MNGVRDDLMFCSFKEILKLEKNIYSALTVHAECIWYHFVFTLGLYKKKLNSNSINAKTIHFRKTKPKKINNEKCDYTKL